MSALPLGPSVELTMSYETREGRAEMGGGPACQRCHWSLRWGSLWGHATCEGCVEMGGGPACQRCHWGLRWSSLWGHATCE
eukprot:3348050-Pyramimonas_sp.AAC.1